MKTLVNIVLGVVLAFLLVAFCNVGFDISIWSQDSRFLCAVMMCIGGFVGWLASTVP